MHANLANIAERDRREAQRLEAEPAIGGDYEMSSLNLLPTQLSAPRFLRGRADRYEQAQREMSDWKPAPVPDYNPRPARRLLVTAAILGGIGAGFLAYIFMAVQP